MVTHSVAVAGDNVGQAYWLVRHLVDAAASLLPLKVPVKRVIRHTSCDYEAILHHQ
jgi:hypothetical protein